jgi:hypothetical protein
MSAADLRDVVLTVADRFKMQPSEIGRLRSRELIYWYEGAVRLNDADRETLRRMAGAK